MRFRVISTDRIFTSNTLSAYPCLEKYHLEVETKQTGCDPQEAYIHIDNLEQLKQFVEGVNADNEDIENIGIILSSDFSTIEIYDGYREY